MKGPSPLSETEGGVRLLVRATPGAPRNEIAGVRNGRLLVKVTAAPEGGKANKAIIKLLSKAWHVPSSAFELVSGASSRDKCFLLHDIATHEIPMED